MFCWKKTCFYFGKTRKQSEGKLDTGNELSESTSGVEHSSVRKGVPDFDFMKLSYGINKLSNTNKHCMLKCPNKSELQLGFDTDALRNRKVSF